MVQCVAVCCSVLQCVAACCSLLQCAAVCCSVLQCVAACNIRQRHQDHRGSWAQYDTVCCSVLQHVAVCCSVLQRGTYVNTTKIITGVGLSEALLFGVSNNVRELHSGLERVENVRQRARKDALHLDDLVARLQEVLLQRACVCACV